MYNEKGLSFAQIASIIKPKITRQRVWQIYKAEMRTYTKKNSLRK